MRRAFTALAFNGIFGDYAEFGCWTGRTFALAHRQIQRTGGHRRLWAFDSFKGLPPANSPDDSHPVWNEGALAMSLGEFRTVCKNNRIPQEQYEVVAGYYDATIGDSARYDGNLPSDVALAYIDCDMYSSTKTVFEFLRSRMKHGMIVALDDYFCASATALAGERKALLEFLATDSRFHFLPYVQFGWHGMSFQLEDRSLLPPIGQANSALP
jgi:hypothetical protein